MEKERLKPREMETILNKKSGLQGITEKFTDRRDIQIAASKGDRRAELCIDMEAYRLKKYIGSYYAVLGRMDAVVFTAGVGELSHIIRERVLTGLEELGIKLDLKRNRASKTRDAETVISAVDSPVKVFVIPTDEELVMTEDTYALLQGTYDIHTRFSYSFQKRDYVNKERAEALERSLKDKLELKEVIAPIP
ncbi:acetate kinase [subsurface metagenome]